MHFVRLFSVLVFVGIAQTAQGVGPSISQVAPPIVSVLEADTVVVGKVTSIEKDLVEVAPPKDAPPKTPKLMYRIANIKVSESLSGAKGVSTLKLGYPAASGYAEMLGSSIDIPVNPYGNLGVVVSEGQEGIFILKHHISEDFYIFATRDSFLPVVYQKKDKDYDDRLKEIKSIVLAVKDPVAALKAKDAESRMTTVGILAQRYRQQTSYKPMLEEKLPAEESKLILEAMLELPWASSPTDSTADPNRNLQHAFNVWLREEQLTLKFGYPILPAGSTPEEIHKIYKQTVTKFVNDNKDKIILKRYVEKK